MQTLTLGTTSDSDSVLIVLKADDDIGIDAERVQRAFDLLGVELEVTPIKGALNETIVHLGDLSADVLRKAMQPGGWLSGKLMSDAQVDNMRSAEYMRGLAQGKAEAEEAMNAAGLYTKDELDAAVQTARDEASTITVQAANPNVGDIVTQDYQYGDYITVYPFPECTIPAPGEHGYIRTAGYIHKDWLLHADKPITPFNFLRVDAVEDRSEFLPVILTVLK